MFYSTSITDINPSVTYGYFKESIITLDNTIQHIKLELTGPPS